MGYCKYVMIQKQHYDAHIVIYNLNVHQVCGIFEDYLFVKDDLLSLYNYCYMTSVSLFISI